MDTMAIVILSLSAAYVVYALVLIIVKKDKIKQIFNNNNYKKRFLSNCAMFSFVPLPIIIVLGVFGQFLWILLGLILYINAMHSITRSNIKKSTNIYRQLYDINNDVISR